MLPLRLGNDQLNFVKFAEVEFKPFINPFLINQIRNEAIFFSGNKNGSEYCHRSGQQ